jgi:hypothetical protein
MRRRAPVCIFGGVLALFLGSTASADVGIYLTQRTVPIGGRLHGWSNGGGFRVYIVPSKRAPHRYWCQGGTGICEPVARHPPGPPFVFLGRVPGRFGYTLRHRFAFRVPAVRPGPYRVFLYCPPCGGSLIQSGNRLEGEEIRVVA